MATNDPLGTQNLGGSGMTGSEGGGVGDRASNTAKQVKQRASDVGRNAVQAVDRGLDTAAQTLQSTASSLRNAGGGMGSGKVGDIANRAADKIEGAATYMREHDARDIMTDVEGAVRRNPGPSLMIAAAFGFLLGSALRGGGSRNRY